MNRKQKKELRQHQSTRQLMGIEQLTEHGIKTARGELIFYLIKPDNLSVLSDEGVRARVRALTNLLYDSILCTCFSRFTSSELVLNNRDKSKAVNNQTDQNMINFRI